MTESIRVSRKGERLSVIGVDGEVIPQCDAFLDRLRARGLSGFTIEAYAYDLAIIHRWLTAEKLSLEQVRSEELHRFLAWERGRASQPKSINRRLHTLRLFYRFARGTDVPGGREPHGRARSHRRDSDLGLQRVLRSPSRQLRVKEPKKLIEPLTIDQVRQLLESMRRYRDLCVAHLMLLCGLRSGEVIRLRLRDFDFHERRIRVTGKGNKERAVPLPTLLIDLLRRYLTFERPKDCPTQEIFVVLQGAARGRPMSRAALRKVFRTRRQQELLSNANPHRLRHTFGTDMARAGVRLPILQRMMGHAYAETTLQYVNVSLTDVAAEFQRATASVEARYGNALGDVE